VTVVSLHPGVVATEIWRSRQEASTLMRFMYALSRPLVKIFAVSSADGAKTTIHCATHPEVANQSGSYYELNFILIFLNLIS